MRAIALISTPASSAASNDMESMLYRRRLDNMMAEADFDANRVKEIREAIANGTFRVNADAVADKLLANSEEFLSHSRV